MKPSYRAITPTLRVVLLARPVSIDWSSNQAEFGFASGAPRMLISMSWIGWALLSAVFAAVTALLAKVGVEHVDSNLAAALRTTVVVVFAWGIALALGKHGEIRSLDRRTLLFLALSGLATGLSWLCYFRALQLGPASRVAPLDKLSVPLVMLFAWLLLGEKMNFTALAGGLLITAGAVVMVMS
jgi:bacterial/archaeal transporter family protein